MYKWATHGLWSFKEGTCQRIVRGIKTFQQNVRVGILLLSKVMALITDDLKKKEKSNLNTIN